MRMRDEVEQPTSIANGMADIGPRSGCRRLESSTLQAPSGSLRAFLHDNRCDGDVASLDRPSTAVASAHQLSWVLWKR